MRRVRVAIMASGAGSNARVIVNYAKGMEKCPYEVSAIFTNNPDAGVVALAAEEGIPCEVIDYGSATEDDISAKLTDMLQRYKVELICLAGFMKKIPADVTRTFQDRILNIHPSLLPAYGGKGMYGRRVFKAVLDAGEHQSGVTIHRVNEEYDEGAIICQEVIPIETTETEASLADKTKAVEHRLYPSVLASEAMRMAHSVQ